MSVRLVNVFLLLICCSSTLGSNILILCQPPVRSHHALCKAAAETLIDHGHEVTLISALKSDKPKYKDIVVDMSEHRKMLPSGTQMNNFSKSEAFHRMKAWLPGMTETIMTDPNVIQLLNDKSQKFDLFIMHYYLNNNLLGIGVKLDCPIVVLSSLSMMQWVAFATRNPLAVESVPNLFTPYSENMNLWERSINSAATIFIELISTFFLEPIHAEAYEKYFPEEAKLVPYNKLKTKISSVLSNTHPSVTVVRPLLPNSVEIAGYHVGELQPLPEDLQNIMDASKNGVIFFSLGSMAESKGFNEETKSFIIKIFSNLKMTVLWKFEEEIKDLPKNVVTRKWLPQASILGHPNTRLFISHGGLLSSTESTHYGIPMLIIPLFGDQPHNAKVYSDRGQSLTLNYDNITETSFKWAIDEMLSNPMYAEKMKKAQQIYFDRPMKPRDLLAYHVEYVIRNGGAYHLTPPHLSSFAQLHFDIIALAIIPLHIIIFLCVYLCKRICRRFCSKKCSKNEKLKKN